MSLPTNMYSSSKTQLLSDLAQVSNELQTIRLAFDKLSTSLNIACDNNDIDAVKNIINYKAGIEQLLRDFREACDKNDFDKAKLIVLHNPKIVDHFNADIVNGFYNVCHHCNLDFAKFMLSLDKKFNRQINFAMALTCSMHYSNALFQSWLKHLNMEDVL